MTHPFSFLDTMAGLFLKETKRLLVVFLKSKVGIKNGGGLVFFVFACVAIVLRDKGCMPRVLEQIVSWDRVE